MTQIKQRLKEAKKVDFSNYDKVFSLSHTDLDGYGSQLVIEKFLSQLEADIEYVNADYNGVDAKIKYIKKQTEKDKSLKYFIFITDLGLDRKQSENLESFLQSNRNVDVQLLDHHQTSLSNVEKYDWYCVDEKNCAAMITYQYFTLYEGFTEDKNLKNIVWLIQVYDLWLDGDKDFSKSNFLANIVFSFIPSYPKILGSHRAPHYIYVIDRLSAVLKDKTVKEAQREIFDICEGFYENKIETEFYLDDNVSMELKHYRHLFLLTEPHFKNFEGFVMQGYRYKVVYDYGNAFQNVAKYMLESYDNVDFLIFVHKNYKVSLRSKRGVNVGVIAEQYFGGGGHELSSGGYLNLKKSEVITSQKDLEDYFRQNF